VADLPSIGWVMRGGQRVHYPTPDARPSPAHEAIVAGGVRAKVVCQIAPRTDDRLQNHSGTR
jgi:hypothetical protein